MGEMFLNKASHGIWETFSLWGEHLWEMAILHGRLMIRSYQRWGSFTNAFSSNLKTVYLNIFPNHEGICTCPLES